MKKHILQSPPARCAMILLVVLLLSSCASVATPPPTVPPLPLFPASQTSPPGLETALPAITPVRAASVPDFRHIVVVLFERRDYGNVVGNPVMPYFNILAQSYTLLDQHYALTHPSLPNYLALISGGTHGISSNCEDCFIDAPSLPDLIEAGGRSWKTYQESMPEPCFSGSTFLYVQKHNPFMYFDSIRLNPDRCRTSVVPLGQLEIDLSEGSLPEFAFIVPNLCHSAEQCALDQADPWLNSLMDSLVPSLEAAGEPYLIILTWDEGQGNQGCCGQSEPAGGRVATVLISPLVKNGFIDQTPYTHYSLLKTISEAWGLSYLGHAADENTALITAPWK